MDPQIRADHKQVACPIPRVCLTDLMLPKNQPPIEVEEAKTLYKIITRIGTRRRLIGGQLN